MVKKKKKKKEKEKNEKCEKNEKIIKWKEKSKISKTEFPLVIDKKKGRIDKKKGVKMGFRVLSPKLEQFWEGMWS